MEPPTITIVESTPSPDYPPTYAVIASFQDTALMLNLNERPHPDSVDFITYQALTLDTAYARAQSLLALAPDLPPYYHAILPHIYARLYPPSYDSRRRSPQASRALTPHVPAKLSDTARTALNKATKYHGYSQHGSYGGVLTYLHSLLTNNPTTGHWKDTRPTYLSETDLFRERQLKPPLWAGFALDETITRKPLTLNADKLTSLIPHLMRLAMHFKIFPYRGRATPRAQCVCVIEAIGLGYLTPTNPAYYNPNLANPDNYRHRPSRKYELPIP